MRCDPLCDSSFYNPLIETTLDLARGDSLMHLAEEECLRISEDLFAFFQIAIQDRPQLGIEKAGDNQSTLGFDGDLLLKQVYICDIQIYQLGQPDTSMQEEIDNYQIAICLPALLRSDSFQENALFILGQKDRRFSALVFDLDTDGWIMIDLSSVGQPPEKAFDRSPGAIDGRGHFLLSIGLLLYRIAKEEAIDFSGVYVPDFAVTTKLIKQQIQITLLGSNRVRRPVIGKLVIQKMFYCLFSCQIVLLLMFVKYHVQQCSENRIQVKEKNEINATLRW